MDTVIDVGAATAAPQSAASAPAPSALEAAATDLLNTAAAAIEQPGATLATVGTAVAVEAKSLFASKGIWGNLIGMVGGFIGLGGAAGTLLVPTSEHAPLVTAIVGLLISVGGHFLGALGRAVATQPLK